MCIRDSSSSVAFDTLDVQPREGEYLYDHRFFTWKSNEIQQYFTSISLKRKCQKFPMVIDEWQKDVSLQGIRWNDEHISQLIRDGLIRNFGEDVYKRQRMRCSQQILRPEIVTNLSFEIWWSRMALSLIHI